MYWCTLFLYTENLTVQEPLPDVHNVPSSQNNDFWCALNGEEIARMEWLFLGDNTIVPMEFTNSSWNNAEFTCIANYNNEPQLIHLRVKGMDTCIRVIALKHSSILYFFTNSIFYK